MKLQVGNVKFIFINGKNNSEGGGKLDSNHKLPPPGNYKVKWSQLKAFNWTARTYLPQDYKKAQDSNYKKS